MSSQTPKLHPELSRYRQDYPLLAESTYMNSNSMGAMHRRSHEVLGEYTRAWAGQGVEAWGDWMPLLTEVADTAARFFGGGPGQTILNQNVAFFQSSIASALELSAHGPGSEGRNKVVIEELMFPNVLYVWERFCSRGGGELCLVPSADGMTVSTERMLEAIDERTAIVSLSHAIYVSGALHDVAAICSRAHEVGAIVMLDGYQTIGAMPIDVEALGVDIMVGGSHKWLCGGPGTAFMWMRPEVGARLSPQVTGWMAHADPFAFEPAPIRYADGPWRFMGGTPSMPAYYVARLAYENLLEIGMETIREHNLALSQIVIDRALGNGLKVHSPLEHEHRTGFVAVDFPGSETASKALIEENYKHDWRPNCGVRVGPHFYNTEEEVHRFMDRVIELAGSTG